MCIKAPGVSRGIVEHGRIKAPGVSRGLVEHGRIKAPGVSRGIENHGGFFSGVTYTDCATSSALLESVESSGCHSGMPR